MFTSLRRRKNGNNNLKSTAHKDPNTRPRNIFSKILEHLSWLGAKTSHSNPKPTTSAVQTEDSDAGPEVFKSNADGVETIIPVNNSKAEPLTKASSGHNPSTSSTGEPSSKRAKSKKGSRLKQSIPGTKNDCVINSGEASYTPTPNNGRKLKIGVNGRIQVSAAERDSIKIFNSGNNYSSYTYTDGRTGQTTSSSSHPAPNMPSPESAQVNVQINEFIQQMSSSMGQLSPENTVVIDGVNNSTTTSIQYSSGPSSRTFPGAFSQTFSNRTFPMSSSAESAQFGIDIAKDLEQLDDTVRGLVNNINNRRGDSRGDLRRVFFERRPE